MKIFYDFHIHSVLSPCGDEDMTPNNIVNLSAMLGFDVIALTDHNTCGNVGACMEVARGTNLLVLPGIEAETSEEVHIVCLFPSLNKCEAFGKIIYEKLNKIPNKENIFGPQIIMNASDEEISREKNLLITSVNMDIYEMTETAKSFGGIAIPAHIDRASHSVISNLGFIPPDLDINLVEITPNANAENILSDMKRFSKKDYKYIVSSDAHYLEHMREPENFLVLPEFESTESFVKNLDEDSRRQIIIDTLKNM